MKLHVSKENGCLIADEHEVSIAITLAPDVAASLVQLVNERADLIDALRLIAGIDSEESLTEYTRRCKATLIARNALLRVS